MRAIGTFWISEGSASKPTTSGTFAGLHPEIGVSAQEMTEIASYCTRKPWIAGVATIRRMNRPLAVMRWESISDVLLK